MTKVDFLWKLVGVEKANKSQNAKQGLFVEEPEIADDYGVIRYIGKDIENPPFARGDKVYFGKNRQELRMSGKDILVMEASNVLAIVSEEPES